MEATEKHTLDAVKNVGLSCLLCFITGSLYSLGVFSTFVEEAARPPGSLDGVWAAGMALTSFFCMPFMFFAGVYLSQASDSADSDRVVASNSSRLRRISGAGSLSYSLLALAGLGVSMSSALLIQLSFIPVGIAMGLFYVEAMELLGVWVPHRPGLAVGIGQMMFGLGSIVSSSVFKYLVQNYATSCALYMTAAILSLPTAAATPFLQWPRQADQNTHESTESETLVQKATPLSWRQLVRLSSFWMYVITIFCLQAGYAFIGYYFEIGQTFGKDISTLVTSFQAANVAGTLFRPMTGALVDVLKTRKGFFSLGSKNMILALFLGQTVSFLALIQASWTKSYAGYALFAGTILAVFASGSCCAPLLAREQFGAVNSSVVFGTGGSISMGLGETVAILLMAAVEGSAEKADIPTAYQGYYILSFAWSVIGVATCVLLKAQKFGSEPRGEWTESGLSPHAEAGASHAHLRSNSYFDLMTECSSYGTIDGPHRSLRVV